MYGIWLDLPIVHIDLSLVVLELLDSNPQFLTVFETEPTSAIAWGYIKAAALEAKLDHPPTKVSFISTIA